MHESERYMLNVAVNGPTTLRYTADNLPDAEDPGWAHRREETGQTMRLINVHGPFEVEGQHGPYDRCESGWLSVGKDGQPFAVTDEEYAEKYEEAD